MLLYVRWANSLTYNTLGHCEAFAAQKLPVFIYELLYSPFLGERLWVTRLEKFEWLYTTWISFRFNSNVRGSQCEIDDMNGF